MIQEISYGGWSRNLRLSGPTTELILTLEVGPRILRYAQLDGPNVFTELPAQLGGTGEAEWLLRGGHRFWTAPEADHSYEADNVAVSWKQIGESAVEISQAVSAFGFQKTLRVEMLPDETVRVTHLLTNVGAKTLEITPWALSVMAPCGLAVIPQPGIDLHPGEFPEGRTAKPEDYLPNREFILWPYTNLADPRFQFSEHFLRIRQQTGSLATKLGLKLATGWVAYQNQGIIFAKHFSYDPARPYPDRGCSFELYTDTNILELESLAPLEPLPPGESRAHVEHWVLRTAAGDMAQEEVALAFFAELPGM